MINREEHVGFEVLSDFVDGQLDQVTADAVQEHLAICHSCSVEHTSLMAVLSSVERLPKSVLPPDDIWPDLREKLNARKEAVLPRSSGAVTVSNGSTKGPMIPRRLAVALAAAAVVLIALSSGITALVLRGNGRGVAVIPPGITPAPAPLPGAPLTLPASFQQTETEFTRTIDELKQAVDTQRGQLSPETVRTVDHSLAVVDSAIAEARAALLADPNNGMLVDLLSASYQRKLDLLRRTSELGSRT